MEKLHFLPKTAFNAKFLLWMHSLLCWHPSNCKYNFCQFLKRCHNGLYDSLKEQVAVSSSRQGTFRLLIEGLLYSSKWVILIIQFCFFVHLDFNQLPEVNNPYNFQLVHRCSHNNIPQQPSLVNRDVGLHFSYVGWDWNLKRICAIVLQTILH